MSVEQPTDTAGNRCSRAEWHKWNDGQVPESLLKPYVVELLAPEETPTIMEVVKALGASAASQESPQQPEPPRKVVNVGTLRTLIANSSATREGRGRHTQIFTGLPEKTRRKRD